MVDHSTSKIRPELAMTLDCFSEEMVDGRMVLSNRVYLVVIEQVLVGRPVSDLPSGSSGTFCGAG